ncbi:unnamed protein product [Pieris macdunnoughi]|uniref:Uncharacterized protein n=1 Tax=Pieris macdunnoughi TaxID=345717 RepID=A0A821W1E7_9NEOP|nr:unnamed protein product [Pieris macdunnoughi]
MDNSIFPSKKTSTRNIQYRKSNWKIHEFEIWSGERICKVCSLCMKGSLLIWIGEQQLRLANVALGVPGSGEVGEGSAATALLGEDEAGAASLARRLATRLHRPVYICMGQTFDRFTSPLVEKGIAMEIKLHPNYFI